MVVRKPEFIPEIEGMRGFLAIVVLTGHIDPSFIPFFWGSMDVFFCISGYLISRQILIHRGTQNFFFRFVVRRALRIWPAYFAVLAATALFAWAWWQFIDRDVDSLVWRQVLLPSLFLQNTAMYFGEAVRDTPPYFDHSWSVALEEQFYFLAVLVLGFNRKITKSTIRVLCGVVIASGLVRGMTHWWLLAARLDGFALGALIAMVETHRLQLGVMGARFARFFGVSAAVTGLVLVAPHIRESYQIPAGAVASHYFSREIASVAGFALLGAAFISSVAFDRPARKWMSVLNVRVLQYFGALSYSMYLTHVIVVFFVVPRLSAHLGLGTAAGWVMSVALSVLVAHLSHRYIEHIGRRYKTRFAFTDPQRTCPNASTTITDHHR
jgi:peptidoglycan/LPS O-acetylase OafA/YrhL